jgi:hypothetical protein
MKSIRIIRFTHLAYKAAYTYILEKYPDIKKYPYAKQLQIIFSEKLVYSDSFSRGMSQLGHESYDIIYDIDFLQNTWAHEHNIQVDVTFWQQSIILNQIRVLKPDVIVFQHYPPLPYDIWKHLKTIYPFVKKVLIHRGHPSLQRELAAADLVMLASPKNVTDYQIQGINARLLYHYFDETVLNAVDFVDSLASSYPLTFLGSSGYGYGTVHLPRYQLLKKMLANTSIKMWLEEREDKEQLPSSIKNRSVIWIDSIFDLILRSLYRGSSQGNICLPKPLHDLITCYNRQYHSKLNIKAPPLTRLRLQYPDRCHAPVFGLEFYKILARSKITLHRGTEMAGGDAAIRLFQATGMGACLLSNYGQNTVELFEEDKEIVIYRSDEEAIEKSRYLLEHDDVRREIAHAGQQRTLKDHTALRRCEQVDEWLQEML